MSIGMNIVVLGAALLIITTIIINNRLKRIGKYISIQSAIFLLTYIFWYFVIGTWNIFPKLGIDGIILSIADSVAIAGMIFILKYPPYENNK